MTDSAPQTSIRKLTDRLRNEVSTGDLPIVLALLIYLRWADFLEAEQEATAAFEDAEFEPVLSRSMHWRTWHQLPTRELQEFLRERLVPTLEQLSKYHHLALAINLHRVGQAFNPLLQLSELSLSALVRWLEEQPFETPTDRRRLLDTFDAIIEKLSDTRFGEYRTPGPIARLMASLGRPTAGERIYDPAFGMANLLTNACDVLARRNAKERPAAYTAPNISASGVEINANTYVIGLTRLALAGVDDPHLELGNSLERYPASHLDREGFDLILADPPFGMRVEREGLDNFPIRSRDATSLFIQHALANLRSEGRAIIVVPYGLLSNRNETDLRRWLIERHHVEAVIQLPDNAFEARTRIGSCLMILGKNGPTSRVRMVDSRSFLGKHLERRHQILEIFGIEVYSFDDLFSDIEALTDEVYSPVPGKHSWDIDVDELIDREWDLAPKLRIRSELTRVLDELSTQVETHRLDEICEIRAGRSISSADLVDRPPGENPVPYIRIKDVEHGKASRSSSWLSANAIAGVKPEWKLRAGDILLSKSGTIGKAGIVQNGALGAIAASGNYVIRTDKDQIDPHFLLGYLDSNACRSWLKERASGSVISHLSIRVISELPVPVPPLPIQQRIASQYRDHKVDAFLYLTKLLSQSESDPVADSIQQWIDRALRTLTLVKGQENPIELDLNSFEKLAANPPPIKRCGDCGEPYWLGTIDEQPEYASPPYSYRDGYRDHCLACWLDVGEVSKTAPKFEGGGSLVQWSIAFNDALKGLTGLSAIPRGTSLLHLLQSALVGIRDTEKQIRGHLPDEDKARRLTLGLVRNLSLVTNRLLGQVELEFQPGTDHLRRGAFQTFPVRVLNRGDLPLREIGILSNPFWGEVDIPFLGEHAVVPISLNGTAPENEDRITFRFCWTATNLAGQKLQGEREIALRLDDTDSESTTEPVELVGSPYVCGDPVRPERNDVFFGREDFIEQIRRQVIKSGNVILLEGNRRAGKTSILRHLEGTGAIAGWLGVYCSLQGAEGSQDGVGVPTAEVFREIAKSLARAVHGCGLETPLPDGSVLSPGNRPLGISKACRSGIGQEASFADFREYADVLLELLREHDLGALLMLDEFDKLQEGIDNGITSPQVPENIRFLVQTHSGFSAILTGSRRLKRLREEYWSALFGLGTRLGVSSLSRDAARRLVTEPVQGRISHSDEAVERAIDLTASQPYLLQCLCNRIFDRIARGTNRTVTIDTVDAAGKDLVQDNEHFASLWAYAATHRRRFLLAICNLDPQERDPLRLGELSEILSSHGIEISDDALIADLEFLRELELVDLVTQGGEGRYRLTIPLMGQWIKAQQDLDALRTQAQYETEDEHA